MFHIGMYKENLVPTYSFYDTKTDEYFDAFMSYSQREQYLKDNPHISTVVTSAAIVSGVSTTGKVPDGFKEVLSKVAEAHPSSVVGDRYGRRSIKQARTDQVVKKHVEKITKRMKS